ncbi:MAG: cytochrome P450 [Acidimicrobiales bacterium]
MVEYDSLSDESVSDPYPAFQRLQDDAPVYHNAREDLWYLSRYDDVRAALVDWETFSSSEGSQVREDPARIGKTMTTNDPPRHDQIRRLVQKGYTPGRVQRHEPRIASIVNELLDNLPEEQFDMVGDFAGPLTGLVIGSLIGIPDDDLEMLRVMIDEGLAMTEEHPNGKGLAKLFAYVLELVAERRKSPGDDMISDFCAAEDAGFTMSDLDIAVTCGSILGAGFSSTGHQIGNTVLALHRFPDVRRRVLENPDLIPAVVEEGMRWDVSTYAFARKTMRNVPLHDTVIPEGSRVVLLLGAANRDPRHFDRPEDFDLERDTSGHLGLGFGIHYCMGAALARMEMRIAFEQLLPRLGDFEIDFDNAVRLRHHNFRGFRDMPVIPRPVQ